jgi:hypothetical protein
MSRASGQGPAGLSSRSPAWGPSVHMVCCPGGRTRILDAAAAPRWAVASHSSTGVELADLFKSPPQVTVCSRQFDPHQLLLTMLID